MPSVEKAHCSNRSLVMLAIGQTIVWSCLFYVFPALLIRWESAFSWSRVQLTGAITLALLVSAFLSPLFGRIIDRGAAPYLLAGGALLGGICLFLLSYVTGIWQFYLLWTVIGCSFAMCLYEPCFALLIRAYGEDAKRVITIVALVAGFASTISFPSAHLIASYWDWQTVTRCFALAVLFFATPLLFISAVDIEYDYKRSLTAENTIADATLHKSNYFRNGTFMRLAISFALLAVVHGATLHHLLHILSDRGLTLVASVFVASLIGPMQVFGRVFIAVLQDYLSHNLIVYGAFVFMGSAMLLLYISYDSLTIAVLFVVVFGSGYGTLSIIRPVISRDLLGAENFGAKSGGLAFFYLIGAAASPYVGSLVWLAGGYDLVIIMLMLLAFSGLWLVYRAIQASSANQFQH